MIPLVGFGYLYFKLNSMYDKQEANEISTMIKNTLSGALTSAKLTCDELDFLFAGDLLNQCTASSFGLKAFDIPFFGLFSSYIHIAYTKFYICMEVFYP